VFSSTIECGRSEAARRYLTRYGSDRMSGQEGQPFREGLRHPDREISSQHRGRDGIALREATGVEQGRLYALEGLSKLQAKGEAYHGVDKEGPTTRLPKE
jgi:hypothetical protein